MAFPTIDAGSTSGEGKNKSLSITLPSGLATGDRVIIIAQWQNDGSPTSYPAGWTSLINNDNTAGADSQIHAAYRDCDGTEPSSITFSMDSARDTGWRALLLKGCDLTEPPTVSTYSRSATSSNTPNDVSWSWSGDTLAITQCHVLSSVRDTTPTGYTMLTDVSINAGSSWLQSGHKDVTSSPESPAAFGFTGSANSGSVTIAVKGTGAGGTTTDRATAMAGASTVAAVTTRSRARAAAVTAASTVAVAAARTRSRSAAIAATSTVTASGSTAATVDRATAVAATSTFTASPTRIRARAAAIAATSTVAATTARTRARSAAVAATSTLTVVGSAATTVNRSTAISAASTVTAATTVTRTRSVAIGATSTFTATRDGAAERAASIAATSAIVVSAEWIANRAALVGGQSACSITATFQPTIWTRAASDGEAFTEQVSGEYQDESGGALLDDSGTFLIGNPLETWTVQTGTGETWTDA